MKKKIISDFNIKIASNADTEIIKNIVFSVLKEYGLEPNQEGIDTDLDDIEASYINNNGYFGLIFDPNGKALGTFGLYNLDDDNCEIRKMYFLPKLRGKGWGKKIMKVLITKAIEKGYKNVVLETNSVLKEAISLYEKCGFEELNDYQLHSRCDKAYILKIR